MIKDHAGRAGRAAVYAVALPLRGSAALAAALARRQSKRGMLARHAVAGILLGIVAWILAGVMGLAVARGALYGLVDDGPYDDSWGGPTRGGAWLAHLAFSLPLGAIAVLLLVGVARLHQRMSRRLDGEQVILRTAAGR